jgi:hydrogenase/urease accessory protein HupE
VPVSWLLSVCLFALALAPWRAEAHRLAPSLLEIRELAPGRISVLWKTPLLRAPGSSLRPALPSHCEPLGAARTSQTEVALIERWELRCEERGLVGSELAVEGLAGSGTDVLIRVSLRDGRQVRAVASARIPRFTVPAREQPIRVITDYTLLGIEHLATGLEHLLFVTGLLLLVSGGRRILIAVTAFTVGHSVTLALAVLGIASLPTPLVEIGIAGSLVALAVELAAEGPDRRRHPWLLALLFGLLHGFGFAGVLREAGLPAEAIPLTLFSFNLGIEIGQLAFVALALNTLSLARPFLDRIPAGMGRVPTYAIGSLGVFWCLDRGAQLF